MIDHELRYRLEWYGAHWLKWERRCIFLLMERSPREMWNGRPDLLGITASRYMIEIEIKRSLSDFRANARKDFHSRRSLNPEKAAMKAPKLFYFLVPPTIAEKCAAELPENAGLLTVENHRIKIITGANPNRLSQKFTIKECAHAAHLMANQVYSMIPRAFEINEDYNI